MGVKIGQQACFRWAKKQQVRHRWDKSETSFWLILCPNAQIVQIPKPCWDCSESAPEAPADCQMLNFASIPHDGKTTQKRLSSWRYSLMTAGPCWLSFGSHLGAHGSSFWSSRWAIDLYHWNIGEHSQIRKQFRLPGQRWATWLRRILDEVNTRP